MAVTCLGSLADACQQPLRFRVHDDGTLTDEDKNRLAARLPDCSFIGREFADERMAALLARHPACHAFRARQIHSVKLFDVPLLSGGDAVACCDSDILFLRPFTGLFEFSNDGSGGLFMQDWQEAYALRPWHLGPWNGLAVPRKFNSGLLYLQLKHYDLDFLEWIMRRNYPVFSRLPAWLEQTCWGALAWRANGRYWDDRQFCVVHSPESLSPDLVGAHFTSSARSCLPGAVDRVRRDLAPVTIHTVPMTRLGAFQLAGDQVLRFIRTRVTDR